MALFNQPEAKLNFAMCTTKKTTQERTKGGKDGKVTHSATPPPPLLSHTSMLLRSRFQLRGDSTSTQTILPRSWSAGLSARGPLAFASRPTRCRPHGPTQPCQTQASIPIRANTLAREACIPAKATRGPSTPAKELSTPAKESSTRVWTGSSTLITQCPAEQGRGWRPACPPTATSGRQMRGFHFTNFHYNSGSALQLFTCWAISLSLYIHPCPSFQESRRQMINIHHMQEEPTDCEPGKHNLAPVLAEPVQCGEGGVQLAVLPQRPLQHLQVLYIPYTNSSDHYISQRKPFCFSTHSHTTTNTHNSKQLTQPITSQEPTQL